MALISKMNIVNDDATLAIIKLNKNALLMPHHTLHIEPNGVATAGLTVLLARIKSTSAWTTLKNAGGNVIVLNFTNNKIKYINGIYDAFAVSPSGLNTATYNFHIRSVR